MELSEKEALEITIYTFDMMALLSDSTLAEYEDLLDLKLYCNPDLDGFECTCALCQYYRYNGGWCRACPLESCERGVYTDALVSLGDDYYDAFRLCCTQIVLKCKERLKELEKSDKRD